MACGKVQEWAGRDLNLPHSGDACMMTARLSANDYEAIAALFSAKHWRLSLEDVLPNMIMPCLIFVGEADPLYTGVKECVKNMPNATFVSLPGLGQMGIMSQRRLVLPHITKFLARVSQT